MGIPKGKYIICGMANIDICTGKTILFQFRETYLNNPTTYDQLERFISIHKPSEVIFISNLPVLEMNIVIQYANIQQAQMIHKINICEESITTTASEKVKRALRCEKQIYQKEILERFYQIDDFSVFLQNFYENDISSQSFCFLLDFVYQHNPYLVKKISEPVFETYSDRLILANHTLKQLNIIDDANNNGKYSSVLKMLNICVTPMGKRKFSYQFLNPRMDEDYLNKEYDITEYMVKNADFFQFLRIKLLDIKDISKWTRQIYMKKISPKLVCQIYSNLETIQTIYDMLKTDATFIDYVGAETSGNVSVYAQEMREFILKNIDISAASEIDALQNYEVNFVKRGINKELDEKIETMMESLDKLEAIRKYLNEQIATYEKKTTKTIASEYVKINETEKNNLSLLSTKRRCILLKTNLSKTNNARNGNIELEYFSSYDSEKKNFALSISADNIEFHAQGASNNSIENPQINALCKSINVLKGQTKEIILRVYLLFVTNLEVFQEKIDKINEFVCKVDVQYAKMSLAKKYNYCKPVIKRQGKISDINTITTINTISNIDQKSFVEAKGLRHCLIEQIQETELYVANDIVLGKDNNDGILLYGTNAVGKTSFIRAIGIAVIMAQAGLFVPCREFYYKPYKYIFTRILGNDNLFEGLSTFAVEMSELRTILRLADKNSLILGDELCSGTENLSAISIFVAGIQRLHNLQSSFIFATHLHEIINYEEITCLKSVFLKHMSVIYDREKDVLVYDRKLKDGPGTNMYGLEVCKSLNLPEDFLTAAHEIRNKYYPDKGASLLSLKTSHYNAKKLMSLCEQCGKQMGTEVHHLQHQNRAKNNGMIENVEANSIFHKNHPANLLTLCETCHNEIHKSKTQHKKVKTSKGKALLQI